MYSYILVTNNWKLKFKNNTFKNDYPLHGAFNSSILGNFLRLCHCWCLSLSLSVSPIWMSYYLDIVAWTGPLILLYSHSHFPIFLLFSFYFMDMLRFYLPHSHWIFYFCYHMHLSLAVFFWKVLLFLFHFCNIFHYDSRNVIIMHCSF